MTRTDVSCRILAGSICPETTEPIQWQPPVAVFELENRDNEDLIAYSVWKTCVVRCQFRGVLCYRGNPSEIPNLAATLGDSVIAEEDQFPLLLIVGSRSKTETFPDGFFYPWYWDQRWRCFRKLL